MLAINSASQEPAESRFILEASFPAVLFNFEGEAGSQSCSIMKLNRGYCCTCQPRNEDGARKMRRVLSGIGWGLCELHLASMALKEGALYIYRICQRRYASNEGAMENIGARNWEVNSVRALVSLAQQVAGSSVSQEKLTESVKVKLVSNNGQSATGRGKVRDKRRRATANKK